MNDRRRAIARTAGVLGFVLLGTLAVGSFLAEEPIRRWLARELNAPLKGYALQIGSLDLRLLTADVALRDLVVIQELQPDPPIVRVERISGGLDWRALFSGALVLRIQVERPIATLNLAQIRQEAGDVADLKDKGWQEAIQRVSPFEINQLQIVGGELEYREDADSKPIRIEAIDFRASDIQNVRASGDEHPSSFLLEALIFTDAPLRVEGAADFLASPRPTVRAAFSLDGAPLARLSPATNLVGVRIRGGRVSVRGSIESAPSASRLHLADLLLDELEIDYIETPVASPEKAQATAAAKSAAKAAKSASEQAAASPRSTADASTRSRGSLEVAIDSLAIRNGVFGFVNSVVDPDYRLFMTIDSASLRGYGNGDASRARAPFTLDGRVMDSGVLKLRGGIRETQNGPDLEAELQMEDLAIETLNEALRAHGRLDVVDGRLSIYSEISLRDRRVDGYVKPLIVDLEVSEPEQDREKSLLNRIYQGAVGTVAGILENEPRDQVATVIPISGEIDSIDANGWKSFVLLLRNAFVEAIGNGLESGGRD
ncbi:MAG: DUF748 domain-containing protein [Myxococcota bacterium]